jgi:predicted nucleic acid-binding protein
MADHCYDTSAAVKHYRAEVGTAKVDGLLADRASRHYLSTLGAVEIHSVFARLVRTGQVTAAEFRRLRGRLLKVNLGWPPPAHCPGRSARRMNSITSRW